MFSPGLSSTTLALANPHLMPYQAGCGPPERQHENDKADQIMTSDQRGDRNPDKDHAYSNGDLPR